MLLPLPSRLASPARPPVTTAEMEIFEFRIEGSATVMGLTPPEHRRAAGDRGRPVGGMPCQVRVWDSVQGSVPRVH